MKMKNIIALAAVAVATVAGASTNYVARVKAGGNAMTVIRDMRNDGELAEPAAFREALEAVDAAAAAGKVEYLNLQAVPRCCPLLARAVVGRRTYLTESLRAELLALCGYGESMRPVEPTTDDAIYADYALQSACAGMIDPMAARTGVLKAAVAPMRRRIRSQGSSFVGADGARRVKEALDGLASELNAPRFGRTREILTHIGLDVEWEAVEAAIPSGDALEALKRGIMDGNTAFPQPLQYRLCVALGVNDYNSFVKEYNGK